MKKKLLIIGTVLCIGALAGCGNQTFWDTNYTYNKAIIRLANDEVIEVEIREWCDYDGEQLQIITPDGTVYLTSSTRCDLIRD